MDNDNCAVVPRICPFIFVCDVSKSMSGELINSVNEAIKGLIYNLIDINGSTAHTKVKIAIMTFSGTTTWISGDKLRDPEEYLEEFVQNPLKVDLFTFMGRMFKDLNSALNFNGILKGHSKLTQPVIMLFSDGNSNDEYKENLEELKNNDIYKKSIKLAVGYGESYDEELLSSFIGKEGKSEHFIIPVDTKDKKLLESYIRTAANSTIVSVSSVMSTQGSKKSSSEMVADALNRERKEGRLPDMNDKLKHSKDSKKSKLGKLTAP